ncbi:hypothetical protein VTI74DRAFT_8354 [Chaetomium olivicolor]
MVEQASSNNYTLAHTDNPRSASLPNTETVVPPVIGRQNDCMDDWKGRLEAAVPRQQPDLHVEKFSFRHVPFVVKVPNGCSTEHPPISHGGQDIVALEKDLPKLSLGAILKPENTEPSKTVGVPVNVTDGTQDTTPESGSIQLPVVSVTSHRPQQTQATGDSRCSTTPDWRNNPTGRPSGSGLNGGNSGLGQGKRAGDGQSDHEPEEDGEGDQDRGGDQVKSKLARPPRGEPMHVHIGSGTWIASTFATTLNAPKRSGTSVSSRSMSESITF